MYVYMYEEKTVEAETVTLNKKRQYGMQKNCSKDKREEI